MPPHKPHTLYAPLGACVSCSVPFVSFCTFFYFVPLRCTSFLKAAKFQLSHVFMGLVPVSAAAIKVFFISFRSAPLRIKVFSVCALHASHSPYRSWAAADLHIGRAGGSTAHPLLPPCVRQP